MHTHICTHEHVYITHIYTHVHVYDIQDTQHIAHALHADIHGMVLHICERKEENCTQQIHQPSRTIPTLQNTNKAHNTGHTQPKTYKKLAENSQKKHKTHTHNTHTTHTTQHTHTHNTQTHTG
jgi:hypothetical protein